jgi:Rad3-related DNA helicase
MNYRNGQEETINKVLEECKNHKVVFLDAPTGSGKSFMNLAIANNFKGGFITTPLKLLVDQYDNDVKFNENYRNLGVVIKGKNAYPCLLMADQGVEATADGAICENPPHKSWKCFHKDLDCPYFIQKKIAIKSNVTVTTLAYLFYGVKNNLPLWGNREVLIIDEAHNIDDQLVEFYTINVGKRSYTKRLTNGVKIEFDYDALNNNPTLDNLYNLLEVEVIEIDDYIDKLKDDNTNMSILSSLKTTIKRVMEKITDKVEFLYTFYDGVHIWKPYEVKYFTQSFFNSFKNIVLSSATFISPELLLESIGLPNDYAVVTVKSSFPSKNSPIKLMPTTKINMSNINEALPKILKGLEKIADANKNTKGFVHCKTYNIRDFIFNNANKELKQRLWKHESSDREESLKDWFEKGSNDSIFLSVNMGEGVDLKNDLARWQVILKTPYLYMGDKYVKAHYDAKNGQKWYNQKTIIELIQMCGRIMRSDSDWGITYILDSTAVGLLFGNKEMLPYWFKERINYVRGEIPLEFKR